MIEVILICIFCIIVIVIAPIIILFGMVYLSTNAPIEGWNRYQTDPQYEKKDKRDGC